ncbi:MAG: glycosyltransferase family protein, partial [Planctomycetota bacterium]
MATIYYSMAGEGRGHAVRVRAITEALRHEHRLVLFAPAAAYDFLEPLYRDTDVEVRPIPGLLFAYSNRRLDLPRTAAQAAGYLWRMGPIVRDMERALRDDPPDLVLTDFEPCLPRAAARVGVPVVSVNHQHFLLVNDLVGVDAGLRAKATAVAPIIRWYCPRASAFVVSSFYDPPLRPAYRDRVTPVGVLMRPEMFAATPTDGGHLLVYLRRFGHEHIFNALRHCGRDVLVYGLGEKPPDGRLRFRPISESGFLEDLAGCDALVTTAGNQLVGEAHYLGKPVFAMPEPGNFEQRINAHFLRTEGGGDWVDIDAFG